MPVLNGLLRLILWSNAHGKAKIADRFSSILGSGVRECQDESGRHKLGQRRCYVHFATVGQTDSFSISGATRVCQVVACS